VEQLKTKLMQLNKQLLEEQTRTVALEEEKKRPLNVHRWLSLETTGDALPVALVETLQSVLFL
jgi:predicted RNase H-like nuclease (RuvC/YqgF family)